jgi:hypothetical protein
MTPSNSTIYRTNPVTPKEVFDNTRHAITHSKKIARARDILIGTAKHAAWQFVNLSNAAHKATGKVGKGFEQAGQEINAIARYSGQQLNPARWKSGIRSFFAKPDERRSQDRPPADQAERSAADGMVNAARRGADAVACVAGVAAGAVATVVGNAAGAVAGSAAGAVKGMKGVAKKAKKVARHLAPKSPKPQLRAREYEKTPPMRTNVPVLAGVSPPAATTNHSVVDVPPPAVKLPTVPAPGVMNAPVAMMDRPAVFVPYLLVILPALHVEMLPHFPVALAYHRVVVVMPVFIYPSLIVWY